MSIKNLFKTLSKTSPQGGNRACLCDDGTYSKECCDGCLQSQGIGATENQVNSNVQNTNAPRVINNSRG